MRRRDFFTNSLAVAGSMALSQGISPRRGEPRSSLSNCRPHQD